MISMTYAKRPLADDLPGVIHRLSTGHQTYPQAKIVPNSPDLIPDPLPNDLLKDRLLTPPSDLVTNHKDSDSDIGSEDHSEVSLYSIVMGDTLYSIEVSLAYTVYRDLVDDSYSIRES